MEQDRETPTKKAQKFTTAPATLRRARAFRAAAVQLLAKPWQAAKVKPPRRSPVRGAEAAERLPGKVAEPVPSRPKGERRPEPAAGAARPVILRRPQIRLVLGVHLHNDPAALFPAGQDAGRSQSVRWAVRKRLVTADGRGGLALTDRGLKLAEFLHRRGHTGK